MSDGTEVDLWTLPGGKMDKGENPLKTIRREISEELGVELSLSFKNTTFSNYFISRGQFKNGN